MPSLWSWENIEASSIRQGQMGPSHAQMAAIAVYFLLRKRKAKQYDNFVGYDTQDIARGGFSPVHTRSRWAFSSKWEAKQRSLVQPFILSTNVWAGEA
jgi:hypothetical protein